MANARAKATCTWVDRPNWAPRRRSAMLSSFCVEREALLRDAGPSSGCKTVWIHTESHNCWTLNLNEPKRVEGFFQQILPIQTHVPPHKQQLAQLCKAT